MFKLFYKPATESRASLVGGDPRTPRYLALRGSRRSKLGKRPSNPGPALEHKSEFVDVGASVEELFSPSAQKCEVPETGDTGLPCGSILRDSTFQETLALGEEKSVTFSPEPEVRVIPPPVEDAVPVATAPEIPLARGFLSGIFDRIFAKSKDAVAVGLVQEVYAGYSGEDGVSDTKFSLGFWQSLKTMLFGSAGVKHRTIRRVAEIINELRPLIDEMRVMCSEREMRDVTPLGTQFIENVARNVLRKALDEGRIPARRMAFLKRLLVRLAPLSVDEDDFAEMVGEVVRVRRETH